MLILKFYFCNFNDILFGALYVPGNLVVTEKE